MVFNRQQYILLQVGTFNSKHFLSKLYLPNSTKEADKVAAFNECVISQIDINVNGIKAPPKIVQN